MKCLNNSNNYKLYASCCDKYICCHLCHNKNSDHKIKRLKEVKHILCSNCNTINENMSNECSNCKKQFSKFFCNKCKIHSDSNMFHCEKCNICYYEKEEDLIHCDNCNMCFMKKSFHKHKCSIVTGLDKCQICFDKIFLEEDKTCILKCSHLIHKSCLNKLKNFNKDKILRCTICNVSVHNSKKYEKKYDEKINELPVNLSRQDWKTEYLCFDCHDKDITKYHYYYHKCLKCNSYNTNSLNTIKVL